MLSHWGSRFDYVRRDKEKEIHDSIETMDRVGISFIEKKDGKGFHNYLNETKNTICGRHPISLFLATLQFAEQEKFKIQALSCSYSSWPIIG